MKNTDTMKQRYPSKSNALKFRLLTLTLLTLLIGGGMKAIGQNAYTLNHTSATNKTYYVTSTNELATSDNNTTASGPQAYKFYVSETPNPTSGTKYDHFYKVHVNNASATVTFIFQTTKPVGFSNGPYANENAFKVTKGTLILKLDKDHYDSDITLRRVGNFTTNGTNNQNSPFYLINDAGEASDQRLIIEGLDPKPEQLLYPVNNVKQDTATYLPKRQFVIDGAANISSVSMTNGNPTYTGISTNRRPLFRVETGTLHLTNVTIQNSINSDDQGTSAATHGGIYLMLNDNASQPDRNVDVKLTHCWLHKLVGTSGRTGYPGIGVQWQMRKAHGSGSVVIKRSKFSSISNINGEDSAIRSISGCTASVTIDSCNINNNFGGGVRWQGLPAEPMRIQYTTIKENYCKKSGGGINAKAPVYLTGCKILKNKALVNGGGINYMCFDEGGQTIAAAGEIHPKNLELTMDAATIIDGNEAVTGNGGGIMVWGRLINLTNNVGKIYYDYHSGIPNDPYKMLVNQNGATISNNKAYNHGGGIYIFRQEDASCYLLNCQLSYGNIRGNQALNGNGGGVCINQTGTPTEVNADHPAQNIKVYTGGGENNLTIAENDAKQNGGGLYLYAITDGSGWTAVQKFNTEIELNDNSFIQKNKTTNGFGGGVYLHQGNITMNNATIGGSTAALGNYTGNSGGGIYVNSGSATMLSTLIQHNKANSGSGGGLYVGGGDVFINPNEIGAGIRSKISDNEAGLDGGGVYTAAGKLTAYGSFSESGAQSNHIEIINNKALGGNGGGIYCRGTLNSQSWEYDIRLRRVTIGNNYAKLSGGGVYLQVGKIFVIDGAINDNTADENGGGVYTEEGNIDINATRDERFASEIMGNTAGINGGGLNTHKGYIRIFGTSKDQRIPIANNKANTGSGGGIFCMGEGADNQYITMQHADLVNNKAVNGGGNAGTGVVAGCGGGMYLQKGKIAITDVNIQNNYAKNNGGGINNHEGSIDVVGCFIGSSHSESGEYYYENELTYSTDPTATNDTDRGNKAGNNGGGIYTHMGDIDIKDYVLTSGNIFREESKITFNEAGKNGGGVNTHMGTISINTKEEDDQIEVAFNKAERGGGMYANAGTIIVYNTLIHDNTATLHGGGANNHSGDIVIYGGVLTNNTAEEGHGGGAYTNVGDIDLFQFPSTELQNATLNHGTKVFNNIAKLNGGAFNNHTGRIDIRHATIQNNTSTLGNGGAVFCEGPHANSDKGLGYTIRLFCSDMVQNKTRGHEGTDVAPTGRGGGIYLKYGSIYAHYSNILDNEANINGGGLDNHSGDILLYGCDVRGNRANEGGGGGIFTFAGDITIGPSTMRDGLFSSSKFTIIDDNTAKKDGGGINNQQGNITINGDVVANNTSTQGNGGGIYITDGIINMKGGRIDNNKATHTDNGKGGGVYSGGGEFNIMEREANLAPTVLIVDSQVKRVTGGQTATIHYHLIDQGKYADVTNVEHGIVWGEDSPSIEVVYGSTTGYDYEQGEPACQRITIPAKTMESTSVGIEANKTYKVKAFFRYKTIENGAPVIKTGYSQTMEFVSYSDSPLVISGAVSNITKNSAEGSGKIMDAGVSASGITHRGVQIWTENSTPPTPILPPAENSNLRPSDDETEFFTVPLTGLNSVNTYYARAYASNDGGATFSFGNIVEFKTLKDTPDVGNNLTVSAIGDHTATFKLTMPRGTTAAQMSALTSKGYGFVYSTDDDPTIGGNSTIIRLETYTSTEVTEDDVTYTAYSFTGNATDLTEGTTYYVRAFATGVNPYTNDPTDYGFTAAKRFITTKSDGQGNPVPVVRATSISSITQNQATINCEIYSGYVSETTKYGVYVDNLVNNNVPESDPDYGTHRFPSSNFVPQSTTPPNNDKGTYSVTLTGLTPGTTYYLKAYATNDNGANYSYGNNYNFTALPISQPNVVIISITDIDKVSAKVNFTINNGGGSIGDGDKGVNYSLNSDMSGASHVSSTAITYDATTGVYTASLSGLDDHKTYYVQAYATNSAGTHTCQTVSFQTDFDKPSVVLNSLRNLTSIALPLTSDAVYTVTPYLASGESAVNQSDYVKTYGICWSTLHNPTRNNSDVANTHFQDGTGGDITVVTEPQPQQTTSMTQRFPNTRYWARAYASTATPNDNTTDPNPENHTYSLADIVYCDEKAFLTLPIMESNGASNITSTSASLAGTIASRDPEHHLIKYGVCWGTSENPTRNNDPTHPNYLEVDITSASSTTRPFSFNVTGLTPYNPSAPQTYHYRAYAINRNGIAGTDLEYALTNIGYGPDVEFSTTQFTITAVASPLAGGTVTGGGGYNSGVTCTLNATVTSGGDYTFIGWYLNNTQQTTNTQHQFAVSENATYEARFNSKVTITAGDNGQVSFNGTDWGTTDNEFIYGTCTVHALPNTNYTFVGWTDSNGNEVSTANPYTFPVNSAISLTANFEDNMGRGRSVSTPRPRDIYPAPAREPWDWDDDPFGTRDGEPTVPTVTTGAVTFSVDMQVINAVVSGNTVTELGAEGEDATLVEAGIWYSTNGDTYNATTNQGYFVAATSPEVGTPFSVNLTGLNADQTYYARAYAKNSEVEDYYGFGEAITIVFNSPSVATLSALSFVGESRKAILKGKVTNAGSTGLTQVGVWYSTSSEPYDATSNQGTFIEVSPRPTVNTIYSATIDDGLSGGETYYVRAYATNNNGVTYSFGDPIQLFNPTVATGAVSDQTPTSATVAGSVTGSAEGAEAGIWYSFTGNEYDEDANPGIFKQATIGDGGTISVGLTGLLADQTYYIRAYASNDNKASISFGDAKTYKFSNPEVETGSVSNLSATGATVSGTVTNQGSLTELTNVKAGVWYSTKGGDYNPQMNKGYFVSDPSNPDLNINTPYSINLPGTGCPAWGSDSTYHARAYLNIGTDESPNYVFGNSIRFSKDNVVLVTGDITNVTGNSATVKGTVESLGQYATGSVEAGIWWSKEGPTYDASSNAGTFVEKSPYTVGTEYTVELTNLQGYNQYVRAYAKVTGGDKADTYFFGNLTSFYANSPSVSNNDAVYGGGIFVDYNQTNPARIMFAGGSNTETAGRINENHASEAGGGIYISEDASLYMKYYCEVNDNYVNEGKKGGGVYLNGILKVGENPGDQNKHSLKIDHNWAGNEWEYDPSLPNKNNRSNVYLPTDPKPLPTSENWDQLNTGDKQRVITLLSDISATYVEGGETKYYTKIGLSVDHGFRAVIYTKLLGGENSTESEAVTHEAWLSTLIPNQGGALNSAMFDDANMYYALHIHNTTNPDDLRRQYDYLYGCWTTAVRTDPQLDEDHKLYPLPEGVTAHYTKETGEGSAETWHIYTKYGLAWFTSYVNGLNKVPASSSSLPDAKPAVNAFLERDVDMREHIWVPIGSTAPSKGYGTEIVFTNGGNYLGEFNGQGHIITGLQCRYVTGIEKYGLFGTVGDGGKVKNTFVDEHVFWTFKKGLERPQSYRIGGIASEASGNAVICGSEARGKILVPVTECITHNTYVGGLVGKVNSESGKSVLIHSSMAMPEIHGSAKYVGGLVGELGANNNLFNSFSNPKFPDPSYVDTCWTKAKKVGENWVPDGNDAVKNIYFGGLVGENNGIVENCYSRLQTDAQSNPPIKEPIGGVNYNNGTVEDPVNNYNKSIFGWFAGTSNNANIKYCYGAKEMMDSPGVTDGGKYIKIGTDPSGHGTYTATQRYSGKYGFKHRDHKITAADANTTLFVTEIDATGLTNQSFGGGGSNGSGNSGNSQQPATLSTTTSGGLMTILNAWVELNYKANEVGKNYATWTRTMASPINDDYPVPMLTTKNNTEKFNSVGSIDCIYLLYEDNVNAMWTGDNGKHFDTITGHHPHAAMYLYDVQPIITPASGTTPAVYATVDISGNNNVLFPFTSMRT